MDEPSRPWGLSDMQAEEFAIVAYRKVLSELSSLREEVRAKEGLLIQANARITVLEEALRGVRENSS